MRPSNFFPSRLVYGKYHAEGLVFQSLSEFDAWAAVTIRRREAIALASGWDKKLTDEQIQFGLGKHGAHPEDRSTRQQQLDRQWQLPTLQPPKGPDPYADLPPVARAFAKAAADRGNRVENEATLTERILRREQDQLAAKDQAEQASQLRGALRDQAQKVFEKAAFTLGTPQSVLIAATRSYQTLQHPQGQVTGEPIAYMGYAEQGIAAKLAADKAAMIADHERLSRLLAGDETPVPEVKVPELPPEKTRKEKLAEIKAIHRTFSDEEANWLLDFKESRPFASEGDNE